MAEPVLDINDASLSLWQGAKIGLSSPGYALLEGREYRFGESAKDQARLHPRQINHRFWSQLDMEPLTPAFGPGRHSADLVHSHLLAIHEEAGRPDAIVIAAPGNLQHDQLALLLGIIEQCPFSVAGLVDRAVAAVSRVAVADYNWHVELQLNQALLTGMRWESDQLIRDNIVPIPGSGWLALQECLARAIADAFIRQTRFDPRRSAASEQGLYDQLPSLLQRLQQSGETNFDIEGRQARIERSNLAEACDNHYQRIIRTASAGDAKVFLGATLEGLPGLSQQMPAAVSCAADAVSMGIDAHRAAILADATGVHLITSLTAKRASATTVAPPAPKPENEPLPANTTEPERVAPGRCQIEIEGASARIRPLPGPAIRMDDQALETAVELGEGGLITFADGTAWRLARADNEGDHGA
jgi:hypothetical protein